MLLRLLHYPDNDLSPEARWLVWRWSSVFGLDQSLVGPVRKFCQQLGLTLQQGRRALASFKASGSIEVTPVAQPKGRPLSGYRIASCMRHWLETWVEPDLPHRAKIERVLLDTSSPLSRSAERGQATAGYPNLLSALDRKQRLSRASRWLIAVLLAHAERSGTVTGLSYSRLQRLTGMSRNRLQSQLKKLRSDGILAHHQPGQRGTVLGRRMNSLFVLNLSHSLFGSADDLRMDFVMLTLGAPGQYPGSADSLVESLFVAANFQARKTGRARAPRGLETSKDTPKLLDSLTISPLVAALAKPDQEGALRWLLSRVQVYTLQLLSLGGSGLQRQRGGPEDPIISVIEAVARDFPAQPVGSEQKGSICEIVGKYDVANSHALKTNAAGNYSHHVIMIYALAHHLAMGLQAFLHKVMPNGGKADFDGLSFSLTPVGERARLYWRLSGYASYANGEQSWSGKCPIDLQDFDLTGWLRQPLTSADDAIPRIASRRHGHRFRQVI